ncbi:MAG: hypothetical protein H5T82_01905 [Demequina sp.]|uniref:FMN-binding protein n=1 Tax=Demequina sp. TaxID=2050685 RepID=UPI00198BD5C7|nr:FMN-binding protein [Demequina sp.]MBC7297631.1 hypothetical protein [Demequina sp.]
MERGQGMTTMQAVVWVGASASLLAACSSGTAHPDTAEPVAAGDVVYNDGVYVGPRVENIKGGYQAQVTIKDGVITAVEPVEAGTSDPESLRVNAFAVPTIVERVLQAQSADVEFVSGSSYTSPAFIESIAGALDEATVA